MVTSSCESDMSINLGNSEIEWKTFIFGNASVIGMKHDHIGAICSACVYSPRVTEFRQKNLNFF